jgi:hypothetical protein
VVTKGALGESIELGNPVAVNPQTGVFTFGAQQNLASNLTASETVNSQGVVTGSIVLKLGPSTNKPVDPLDDAPTGASPLITPLRNTPGGEASQFNPSGIRSLRA